jgi:DNA-binding SARP family transcriptional activator
MPGLELKFIGEVEVLRDGERQALPPSKKTRALLAYLALTGRSARRDHLCELLWDLPDDPRGSLRWSLSKLRRLVDDAGANRIVADRSQVAFRSDDVAIDVQALQMLAKDALESVSTERLEAEVARYQGNFLEGLDLTQQQAFHAWCVSERDRVAAAQARLLEALVERLAGEPDRALPYARELVVRSPYDEGVRADLIRLLVRAGRDDEAEQQYRMGLRLLDEIGATPRGLMADARHERPASQPASTPRIVSRPRPAVHAPVPSILVGRDSETDRLRAAFEACVETRRARLLLLQGEPGIGKSRLLEVGVELARASDACVLEAAGFESEAIRPFALWMDALRRLGPEAAAVVFGDERRGDRDALFEGLTRFVEQETGDRPVVVVFDDLQWSDESSAAALHYVTRMSRNRPFFGILAAREEELNDNAPVQQALRGLRRDRVLEDVRIGPLSDADVEKLVAEHRVEGGPSVHSSECRGNPLLAIELTRSGKGAEDGGSLQELVRERLAGLDLDGADVLRWAAVLAPRIDVPALVLLSGLDASRVGGILESAERLAILQTHEHGLRFSHDLIARSVYNDIAPARRRIMHRRVAERLEQGAAVDLDRAADLAHHASLSGDPELAARAMVLAGRLCLRFFANDDALSLATRGLKWVEELPEADRIRLTIELRDVALAAAPVEDWETAAKEYVALAEQALDHGAVAHARLGYHMASYLRWMHGQWSHAREVTLQAERAARGGSEEDHIVGMAETAKCLAMLERDLSQADAMLMEARALAGRKRMSHYAIPAAQGMLHFHRGELDEAEEAFLEARTLCKAAGERVEEFQANEYLVMIDLERGRIDSALERCAALIGIGDKIREGSEAPFARALEGLCRYALDDDDTGLDAALEELRVVDAKHRLACVLTRAALLDVERGRFARAVARAEEALACAEALERASDVVLARVALAEAHEGAGDAAESARQREAMERIEANAVAAWVWGRARRGPVAGAADA